MSRVWLEGGWQPADRALLSPLDGGWQFGDSLFETLLVHGGSARSLAAHLERLALSARLLAIPFSRGELDSTLQQALPAIPWPTARLRLTLDRGDQAGLVFASGSRLLLLATAYHEPTAEQREAGLQLVTAPNHRVNPLDHLPQLKRGNYADCLYAWNHARSRGADEALFVTDDGELLEGATSNLFVLRGDKLITPPTGSLVLAGVTRRQLLEQAPHLGLRPRVEPLQRSQLHTCDEVLLTSSLRLVMPAASLDGAPLPRGVRWKRLLAALATGPEAGKTA